jgi:hypothetical protein
VFPFGLWSRTCDKILFAPGNISASLYADKVTTNTSKSEICAFVAARDFFREHVTNDYRVFLKLNCEGAECDIIDDLLDSGEFDKVDFLMVVYLD